MDINGKRTETVLPGKCHHLSERSFLSNHHNDASNHFLVSSRHVTIITRRLPITSSVSSNDPCLSQAGSNHHKKGKVIIASSSRQLSITTKGKVSVSQQRRGREKFQRQNSIFRGFPLSSLTRNNISPIFLLSSLFDCPSIDSSLVVVVVARRIRGDLQR